MVNGITSSLSRVTVYLTPVSHSPFLYSPFLFPPTFSLSFLYTPSSSHIPCFIILHALSLLLLYLTLVPIIFIPTSFSYAHFQPSPYLPYLFIPCIFLSSPTSTTSHLPLLNSHALLLLYHPRLIIYSFCLPSIPTTCSSSCP